MKFGLEIEFASTEQRYKFRNKSFITGTDTSVCNESGLNGLELRSITFETFPKDDLKEILNKIKLYDSKITKTCGVHIHFSGHYFDLVKLRSDLLSSTKNWDSRHHWCRMENSAKYKVVRIVDLNDYHYEARLFNGTLNFRAVCQYFKILLKCFKSQGFHYSLPGLN